MTHLFAECRVPFPAFTLDARLDLDLRGITAVFGPSGSGKTTLLRKIAGLERAGRACVRVDGHLWEDDARGVFVPVHRRGVGLVFQDSRLFPHLSVRANLAYGLRRTPPAERRVTWEQVVEMLQLGPMLQRRPAGLSGGERQRVALGRAVLAGPRLLLLDEPLASLDAGSKLEILPFIERIAHALEVPILFVSHAMEEVSRLATTLVLMSQGRVLATGPIDRVTARIDIPAYSQDLDAGAVLRAQVLQRDAGHGLTRLGVAGAELLAASLDLPPGTPVNVHIRARDVALSLERPQAISISNILPGRVVQISSEAGPHAHVLVDVGGLLWARVMRKSVEELGLREGSQVFALIKAVAVDYHSLSGEAPPPGLPQQG
ncbi:MAG TPA: molybdenum ABC transporter ATP-binding protein [bacterium]|nr:molybdenum ABC transporter ATP-binding protein [bacterium]